MSVELLHCDCMEYMKTLPDKAFDLAITSPPYNMNLRVNSNGDGYCSRQIVQEFTTKYKTYSDNLPMEDYFYFLDKCVSELIRCCDLVFFNIQQVTGNKPAVYKLLGKYAEKIKDVVIWDKSTSEPAIRDGVLNSRWEYIIIFSDSAITRRFESSSFERGSEENLWVIPKSRSANRQHKASFPIQLPERILKSFSSSFSKVFDPFMGTGTTAIAAHYFGCDFVGCEIDKEYYDAAVERFNRETAQIAMEL